MKKRIYLRDGRFHRHIWKIREAGWEKISPRTVERAKASCRGMCSSRKYLTGWNCYHEWIPESQFHFFSLNLSFKLRGWQTAQQLRTCISLLEDLGLVLNTNQHWLTHNHLTRVLGVRKFSSDLPGHCTQGVHRHALSHSHTHITILRRDSNCSENRYLIIPAQTQGFYQGSGTRKVSDSVLLCCIYVKSQFLQRKSEHCLLTPLMCST